MFIKWLRVMTAALAVTLTAGVATAGENSGALRPGELLRSDFGADGEKALADWKIEQWGDPTSYEIVEINGRKALKLYAPHERSWIAIVKDFLPEEIEGIKELKITAYFVTNTIDKVEVTTGEDGHWSGIVKYSKIERNRQVHSWEKLESTIPREHLEANMTAAVGISYHSPGTWVLIDKIIISADIEVNDPMPETVIESPADEALAQLAPSLSRLQKIVFDRWSWNPDDAQVKSDLIKINALVDKLLNNTVISGNDLYSVHDVFARYRDGFTALMPYHSLTEFNSTTYVPLAEDPGFTIDLPINATEGIVYLLRNHSDKHSNYYVKLTGDAAKHAKLHRFVMATGDFPNFPKPMNVGNTVGTGDFIEVPPDTTVGMLVQFRTDDVEPGSYDGKITVMPFNTSLPETSASFTLNVADVTLPTSVLPMKTFHWDYTRAKDPKIINEMLEGRVNVFMYVRRNDHENDDFSDLREMVNNIRKHSPDLKFQIFAEVWHVNTSGGWNDGYQKWLDRLVKEMEALGLGWKDWYLEIYDEMLGPKFLADAKHIKSIYPEIQIFSDFLDHDKDQMRDFFEVLDVWCPTYFQLPPLYVGYEEEIAMIRETDAELWTYGCGPTAAAPLTPFRTQAMQSLINNYDGTCHWTLAYTLNLRGNQDTTWGFFYRDDDGTEVPARHWIQWKSSMDDYLLLRMARESECAEIREYGAKAEADLAASLSDPIYGEKINLHRSNLLKMMTK